MIRMNTHLTKHVSNWWFMVWCKVLNTVIYISNEHIQSIFVIKSWHFQNRSAYMYHWPGCEVKIRGVKPTFCHKYNLLLTPHVRQMKNSIIEGVKLFKSDKADVVGEYGQNAFYGMRGGQGKTEGEWTGDGRGKGRYWKETGKFWTRAPLWRVGNKGVNS